MDVVVYFFLLGVLARLVKSDLRLPEALYETLSIYLLLAIGLKGGIELSKQPIAALAPQVAACMALGFAIPFALWCVSVGAAWAQDGHNRYEEFAPTPVPGSTKSVTPPASHQEYSKLIPGKPELSKLLPSNKSKIPP